jgi:uncharacterized protein HemX
MSEESPATAPAPSSAPLDTTQAIWQLRMLVCGLGAIVLVLSVGFNAFVFKQNRNIAAASNIRLQQCNQQQARVNEMMKFVSELARYSEGKPELAAIFTRHGIELKPNAPAAAPAP